MWPESKDMNLLQGQVLWGKKREAEECYKSIRFMFFIFQKVKLHPNEVTEKNVKVAKTSTHRKSQIKFAYASLFQTSLHANSNRIFSYTVKFCLFISVWVFCFRLFCHPTHPALSNKTPASISAQDGRHTEDEGLDSQQAVQAWFAATVGRGAVRQQQVGKERWKHCLVLSATEHHSGKLEPISATSTSTQNFVKQVFTDDRDTFYSFLGT